MNIVDKSIRCKKCNKRHKDSIKDGICPKCSLENYDIKEIHKDNVKTCKECGMNFGWHLPHGKTIKKGDKVEINGREYFIGLLEGRITTVSHGIYWGEYEIKGNKALKGGKEYSIKIL